MVWPGRNSSDLPGLTGPAFIDFEASCLPEYGRSYPIGAAVKLLHYKPVCDA